ncbi:hypothetical protein [Pseudomonas sp. LRF_L74]|uniref:hypothetical protein n=1 Tax=Pseudomonas sp. LRF_L74 TaxID=3369422 RepID=UPI003F5F0084
MKCPSCEHEAPQAAFGNPLRCPDCGIFYEKAVELMMRAPAKAQIPAPQVFVQPAVINYGKGFRPCWNCKGQIGDRQSVCHHCNSKNTVPTSTVTVVVLVLVIFFVVMALIGGVISGSQDSTTATTKAPAKLSPRQQAFEDTLITEFDWDTGYGVMTANFVIVNNGKIPVKDIEITCRHTAASGTEIDKNVRTIYDIVPAGKSRTFKNFNMGFINSQVESTRCGITNLKI